VSTTPPSALVKFWPNVSNEPTPQETALHTRIIYNALNDFNQAIVTQHSQVLANTKSVQTVINTSTPTPAPPTPNPFPFLGTVTDRRGNPLYLTQITDNGAKIILGDSSPITLQLNAMVTPPWFIIVDNDSSSTVTFIPTSGSVIGAHSMPDSSFTTIYFDGVNFFAGIPR
jgi:hypothetical protein